MYVCIYAIEFSTTYPGSVCRDVCSSMEYIKLNRNSIYLIKNIFQFTLISNQVFFANTAFHNFATIQPKCELGSKFSELILKFLIPPEACAWDESGDICM